MGFVEGCLTSECISVGASLQMTNILVKIFQIATVPYALKLPQSDVGTCLALDIFPEISKCPVELTPK